MHAGDVRLLVQPSTSYRNDLCATLVDPDGVPVQEEDRSYLRPSVQTFLHRVVEEKHRLRGPFWNRRDVKLGAAVRSVMENNELSGNGLFKGVYVGAREDTLKLPSGQVAKQDLTDVWWALAK